MKVEKLTARTVLAAMMAASFWAWSPVAAEEVVRSTTSQTAFRPIQSIGYDLGSKLLSAYFVQHKSTCMVTLMVIENTDEDGSSAASATRVRLVLDSGQGAGLDSEEGRSVNFTCRDGGATLIVEPGSATNWQSSS